MQSIFRGFSLLKWLTLLLLLLGSSLAVRAQQPTASAKFYHPQTETTFCILNDRLYTRVEESAGGTEKVSIYRMIWK